MDWKKEPALLIGGGGMALLQAVMAVLIAFDVPITAAQQAALTGLVAVILGFAVRANVVPVVALPAGVAGQIADTKAAAAADKGTS